LRDYLLLFILLILPTLVNIQFSYSDIQFEDVTKYAGINYTGKTYGSSWGDFNNDDWPDLLTLNHGSLGKGPNLFINNQDGTFSDILPELNIYELLDRDLHVSSLV